MSDALRLRFINSALMSSLMSFLMTGWLMWLNYGFNDRYPARWGHAFLLAWPAAFVVVLIIAPTMLQFSRYLVTRMRAHSPNPQ
jgi:hypothetical protein